MAAAACGRRWVAAATCCGLTPKDPTAIQTIPVGQGPGPTRSVRVPAWVVNTTDGTMRRIDGTTFKVSKPISVGRLPGAVAVGGGWYG